MAVKNPGISADLVIHPGETISDVLEERGLTQKELAQRAGVSEAFLSDVIHGKKDISKSLAMGLEYALDVPASFWLNLQANYDAELLALQEEESVQAEEITVLTDISEVLKYLENSGILSAGMSRKQTVIRLRKYFHMSRLNDLGKLVPAGNLKSSDNTRTEPSVLGAWLCVCKARDNAGTPGPESDSEDSDAPAADIGEIIRSVKEDHQEQLLTLLARYGIGLKKQ